jgi:hypothetical protein
MYLYYIPALILCANNSVYNMAIHCFCPISVYNVRWLVDIPLIIKPVFQNPIEE